MNLRSLHDHLVVERLEEGEQVKDGILVPDSAKEKPQRGEVIAAGANPIALKRGIEKVTETVTNQPVKGKAVAQVASVSANNDLAIGQTIAETLEKVGKDGVITADERKTMETELEVVEGMQFDPYVSIVAVATSVIALAAIYRLIS